jgi:hypothetical protein
MDDNRRYKRFTLNFLEVNGELTLASKVSLLDISMGGLSLKADIRLDIGRKYVIKLEDKLKRLALKGVVMWSRLSGTRSTPMGETLPLYTAGMKFIDLSEETIADLRYFVEHNGKEEALKSNDRRLYVRFHFNDPEKEILNVPAGYKVKTISLGGMLIECLQDLELESRMPMELFINDDNPFKFVGRVASCQVIEHVSPIKYAIGIEFLNLTDKDREVLTSLMDESTMIKSGEEPESADNKTVDGSIPEIPQQFMDKVEYLYKWHNTMGYYKFLGISNYATDEQIKSAFLAKAHEFHPDKFPKLSDDLKHKLNEIFVYLNAAHSTLMDPQKRKEYDKSPTSRIRH